MMFYILVTLLSIKISILLYPVIPSSIDKALNIYNLSIDNLNLNNLNKFSPDLINLNIPKPLFFHVLNCDRLSLSLKF